MHLNGTGENQEHHPVGLTWQFSVNKQIVEILVLSVGIILIKRKFHFILIS